MREHNERGENVRNWGENVRKLGRKSKELGRKDRDIGGRGCRGEVGRIDLLHLGGLGEELVQEACELGLVEHVCEDTVAVEVHVTLGHGHVGGRLR